MITRTEAIKNFLTIKTHPDLAALYHQGMEVQVNVAQDGGTRIDGEYKGKSWQAWTDGAQRWKSYRIPHNAATAPEYDLATAQTYDLIAHAEGIGMTGWDWHNKLSRWVAYDFDAISGHKHDKKLTDEQLLELQRVVESVPWVSLRRSTGGKGLHLYVFLEPTPTENHTEHAALARAILGKLSALTGVNFEAQVDKIGGNMWVWHRKMESPDGLGLSLIKNGGLLSEIPINWRDHVKVVTGRRRKPRPSFIADGDTEGESLFDELVGQRPKIPLDDAHKRLLRYLLEDNRTGSWWDSDHWMLVAHTYQLKRAHKDLSLRGIFDTISTGDDNGTDKNCFLFPLRRGGWAVRRYGLGVSESPTWAQDSAGYTRCYLNIDPDLRTAARAFGGKEFTDGSFRFDELEVAMQAAKALGIHFNLPAVWAAQRPTILYNLKKDGRLVVKFERKSIDTAIENWLPDKEKWWIQIFGSPAPTKPVEMEPESTGNYDDLIRHLVTETGEDFGWVIRSLESEADKWVAEPLVHVKSFLKGQGIGSKEVELMVGSAVARAWQIVNIPFADEYPGERKWNRNAAQLKYIPTASDDLSYTHWSKVLKHCGQGLDEAVSQDGWCKANGILNGADYLKAWIAALFQKPLEPLPYLFFYSPEQDTGKSIFHEAIAELMTKGYARADAALINQAGFNAEIRGALLCVVEETNLGATRGKSNDAYNRIKDWVTARHLPIHEKGRTPYHVPNSTHWVQCSNDVSACPIFPGDTRITMIRVPSLDPTEMIPKEELINHLRKEAADFLAAVIGLELPPAPGRLSMPVLATEEKLITQEINRNPVEAFIEEHVFVHNGQMIPYSELWNRFLETLPKKEEGNWTQQRFGRELALKFPKGRNTKDAVWCFGNLSFMPPDPTKPPQPPLTVEIRNGNPFLVPNGKHQGSS